MKEYCQRFEETSIKINHILRSLLLQCRKLWHFLDSVLVIKYMKKYFLWVIEEEYSKVYVFSGIKNFLTNIMFYGGNYASVTPLME